MWILQKVEQGRDPRVDHWEPDQAGELARAVAGARGWCVGRRDTARVSGVQWMKGGGGGGGREGKEKQAATQSLQAMGGI